jgi:aspartyl-tRNA(Asn)/glutamyl-tRNA(Gln) amidotransferase subunit C
MPSMSLTIQEVEHIAKLARLELTAEEKNRYREQLSAILEHVARLQKLDTAAIPPTASVFGEKSPLRPDQARPGLARDELLQNAPEQEKGQFKIPPVFE